MPKTDIDILVYIALAEEFLHLKSSIDIDLIPSELDKHAFTCYTGTIKSTSQDYKVVFFPAGKMGNTESAQNTQALINHYNPKNIVVLGIAGSLSDDLAPGDVFVPSNVVEYLANSAGIGNEDMEFKTSGNHYASNPRLLNRFQNIPGSKEDAFKKWQDSSESVFEKYISDDMQNKLNAIGVDLKNRANLKVADDRNLASGPVVGKGDAFSAFLKKIDRKLVAIEMETAGVYAAGSKLVNPIRIISIRGISDIANEKKNEIEAIVGEELRRVCMKNAVSIFKLAVENDLFKDEYAINPEFKEDIVLASTIKNVFIVGGQTGDGGAEDDLAEELRTACKIIGNELAKSKIELTVCSPFADSADYYAVLGYAAAKNKGRISYHLPNNNSVIERQKYLESRLKEDSDNTPEIVVFRYANYLNEDLKQHAWNICQIQALQNSDAVVAIGGRESSSADWLLHLAELWGKPIVPFAFIGGAAKLAYDRISWNSLYPNIAKKSLSGKSSVKNVVDILNKMSLRNIALEVERFRKINDVFISRASSDYLDGDEIRDFLTSKNIKVLLGDDVIVKEKEVVPSINESISQSQLFIALWSKNYALSTWCNDELMYAIEREKVGLVKIILVLIDDTPIIPFEARSAIKIRKESSADLNLLFNQILMLD
ncbi:TIR domain-containing protein [Sphingobacterium siyangense]|uniref:phosphorylase family protein n=1 Tax=Sphingobacterium siyangense TaxID=459529 RepID=UPI003DA4AF6D